MTASAPPASAATEPPRIGPGRAVLLHILPGIPPLAAYTLFAAVLAPRGLPTFAALALALLVVEVPFTLWLLRYLGRQEQGSPAKLNWRAVLPWHKRPTRRQYILIGIPLAILSVVLIGAVGTGIQNALLPRFTWVPDWFVLTASPEAFAGLSRPAGIGIAVLSLGMMAGAVTQELYFRGYLLPRIAWMGGWAQPVNAALFAVFHLIAPWGWPGFFLTALPWAMVVRHTKSLQLSVFAHVGMMVIQWLGLTLILTGLVSMPG